MFCPHSLCDGKSIFPFGLAIRAEWAAPHTLKNESRFMFRPSLFWCWQQLPPRWCYCECTRLAFRRSYQLPHHSWAIPCLSLSFTWKWAGGLTSNSKDQFQHILFLAVFRHYCGKIYPAAVSLSVSLCVGWMDDWWQTTFSFFACFWLQ